MHIRIAFITTLAVLSIVGIGPAAAQNAYITNSQDGTVSVIDTTSQNVVATISVGLNAFGVTMTADGSRAYVSFSPDGVNGMVSAIDTETNAVVATIPGVGRNPSGLAVTPDGSKLYVGDICCGHSTVYVIDTATNAVVGTIAVGTQPFGLAITPNGTKLYVTNRVSGTVSVIDTTTDTVTKSILVGADPRGVAVTPTGSEVYVANNQAQTITVISTATDTVTNTIAVDTASHPTAVAAAPDGSRVYVSEDCVSSVSSGCGLSVIATVTHSLLAVTPLAGRPYGVSLTPDGSHAYVAVLSSNSVSVISTATFAATNSIGVGNAPIAFGIFIQPIPPAPTFAGTPGNPNCHGQSVAALAQTFGGLDSAATTLGFSSVKALESGIRTFCNG